MPFYVPNGVWEGWNGNGDMIQQDLMKADVSSTCSITDHLRIAEI